MRSLPCTYNWGTSVETNGVINVLMLIGREASLAGWTDGAQTRLVRPGPHGALVLSWRWALLAVTGEPPILSTRLLEGGQKLDRSWTEAG